MRTSVSNGLDGSIPGQSGIAVVHKALDLIESLVAAGGSAGLTQLSNATGINKATAHRILTTLEARGYLTQTGEARRYVAGNRMVALAAAVTDGSDLVQTAKPVLESLRSEFGETANLGVISAGAIEYLVIVEADHGLRMAARPGTRDHLHSTALGKAILAAMDDVEAQNILTNHDRPRLTVKTITSVEALKEELASIRERGFAIDDEENELGARCIAAAVVDDVGHPVAAISISSPLARVPSELVTTIGQRLMEHARALSKRR